MGHQNQGSSSYSLIAMTNKDVYYVERDIAKELISLIETNELPMLFIMLDVKSGAEVAITTSNISSIVMKRGYND